VGTTGVGVPVSVGVDDGGKGVGVAVGEWVGVWVQVGMGVALAVAVEDGSPSSDHNAVGMTLLGGVGREVQVAVGFRTVRGAMNSVGANEVSVIAGARGAPTPQLVIPHNNTTRPNTDVILLISVALSLPIVFFQH
jgi:hypothetical protein